MAKLGGPDVFSPRLVTPSTSRPTCKQFRGPKYYKRPHAAKFHADIKVAMCAAVEEDTEDKRQV